MPGRSPHDAFEAFIKPIQGAVSCLGTAKITTSSSRQKPGAVRAWSLNKGNGMALPGARLFRATMQYEVIQQDDSSWRVTTRAYMYTLLQEGEEVFSIQWHPDGKSDYDGPHLHLGRGPGKEKVDHLPTGRLTFEDAIEWVIQFGTPPARDDWQEVLAASKELHIRYRTWTDQLRVRSASAFLRAHRQFEPPAFLNLYTSWVIEGFSCPKCLAVRQHSRSPGEI